MMSLHTCLAIKLTDSIDPVPFSESFPIFDSATSEREVGNGSTEFPKEEESLSSSPSSSQSDQIQVLEKEKDQLFQSLKENELSLQISLTEQGRLKARIDRLEEDQEAKSVGCCAMRLLRRKKKNIP